MVNFTDSKINNLISNEEWILDTTINKVSFYHKLVDCERKNAVLLKFNNLNSKAVTISFKENFTTKQVEGGLESYSGVKEINIATGLTAPINCEDLSNPKLIILPQQVDPTYLSDILTFSFKDTQYPSQKLLRHARVLLKQKVTRKI